MPVTKSAKRALRVSRKRQAINLKVKKAYKKAFRWAREEKSASSLRQAYSFLDTAAKKGVIHHRKAARLKSHLAKLTKEPKTKKLAKKAKISPKAKNKL